jgi:carbamoyltransferase
LKILGISAYYHDSAAVIIENEEILTAAQEERFSRIKHDNSFPSEAVKFCLEASNARLGEIDYIVFYDKPILKFERLLETYLSEAPKGFRSFAMALPVWLKEKLFLKNTLVKELKKIQNARKKELYDKIYFSEHHISHAASAFYPSPFEEAAIITIDGVGEWTTTSIAHGKNKNIEIKKEIHFPHSLGLLYSAFTYFTGFKVNSGEYKLMGLAPYGEPKYVDLIKKELINIKEDGSFKLNMEYFNYTTGLTMINKKFHNLFKVEPRQPESQIDQKYMDIARSIQIVTEEILLKISRYAKEITGCNNLCLAGGVALNCVANGKIFKEKIFEEVWIQPAAGDAGGALGAALAMYHMELKNKRTSPMNKRDKMRGALLGPEFSDSDIEAWLIKSGAKFHKIDNQQKLYDTITEELENEKVIGWFRGRMEFGPRALGSRSIIADTRSKKIQSIMNLKIKFRESFRPFAPSVLREKMNEYFDMDYDSPYMLFVANVNDNLRIKTKDGENVSSIDKINIPRSIIPAVTHVDYSARVQTVSENDNPDYYNLIKKFEERTGCAVIVNTSFNIRGEPIVCSSEDAYRCFMKTEMDILAIGSYILYKEEQQ